MSSMGSCNPPYLILHILSNRVAVSCLIPVFLPTLYDMIEILVVDDPLSSTKGRGSYHHRDPCTHHTLMSRECTCALLPIRITSINFYFFLIKFYSKGSSYLLRNLRALCDIEKFTNYMLVLMSYSTIMTDMTRMIHCQ